MRRRRADIRDEDENVFALSTGDLMAGLLFTFILIFGCAMLLVHKDYVKK